MVFDREDDGEPGGSRWEWWLRTKVKETLLARPRTGVSLGGWGLLRGDERMLFDGVQHIQELDLGGERVAMVDDGEIIWAIPAVH